MLEVDVAVVGAGGAGLALVLALDRLLQADQVDQADQLPQAHRVDQAGRVDRVAGCGPAPSLALIDPAGRDRADRTWCYWTARPPEQEPGVARAWREVQVVDRAGRARTLDLHPLRYLMVPSAAYYALGEQAADRLDAVRITAAVDRIEDGPGRATVRAGGRTVRARYVFDSRPGTPRRPARTSLLQHFRGWTVRFPEPVLDPERAVLMDFRAAQPRSAAGLGFGYVLPLDGSRALVEYTQFSRDRCPAREYDDALRGYLSLCWPELAGQLRVESVEDGVIPMSDAVYPRRTGRRVFRLGTAGGATRGSTGYTFAAMQRQAAAVAGALLAGREPVPPPAYPARHRWLDAVLLRALDRDPAAGPDLLFRLLTRNPPERILAFLDGTSTLGAELAVMRSAPQAAMLRATAGDAAARLAARTPAPARPAARLVARLAARSPGRRVH